MEAVCRWDGAKISLEIFFTPSRSVEESRKQKSSEAIMLLSCTNAMEPATGLEPVTPALRERCSTN